MAVQTNDGRQGRKKRDEALRDAARLDPDSLVAYQAKWERALQRLARRYPERFCVPGLSNEEVCDMLTLRLVEVVLGDVQAFEAFERPDQEWGLAVMLQRLSELRRQFRLAAEPVDFGALSVAERGPNHEEAFFEHESSARREAAALRATQRLSRSEQQWFSALKFTANCGQFFTASGKVNLSAASRLLGKDRSNALRAFRDLRYRFQSELGDSDEP
jgi:hypothetical protein